MNIEMKLVKRKWYRHAILSAAKNLQVNRETLTYGDF